jgi:hypothetical protein
MKIRSWPLLLVLCVTGVVAAEEKSSDKTGPDKKAVAKEQTEDCCEADPKPDAKKEPAKPTPAPAPASDAKK